MGPEASGEETSPPLLIHLQYEEVWGTLPGREHKPGEVTTGVLPPNFHLLGHSQRPGIQKSSWLVRILVQSWGQPPCWS